MGLPVKAVTTAQTWYVSGSSGSDSNSCSSQFFPCRTINAALAKSSSGDTIVIGPWIYIENIVINKNITISGIDPINTNTVIDGNYVNSVISVPTGVTATIKNITLTDGSSSAGGGIYNAGTTSLINVIITNNTARDYGGGIVNTGTLTIAETSIRNNSVTNGSGGGITNINSGNMTVNNSAIYNNTATNGGGGVFNLGLPAVSAQLTNVTISGNSPDGLNNNNGSTATLTNLTITANGTGIFNSSNLTIKNTIVANNNTRDCFKAAAINSLGYNLVTTDSCGFKSTGDLIDTNPQIGPLANYGGNTYTQILLSGSPAINAGTNINCPSTDQRGVSRPQQGVCDIGAFESGAEALRPIVVWIHGYKGFDSPFHSSDPLVKYDPNTPHDKAYVDMIDWLYQDGYDVWMVHYDTGPDGTANLYSNALKLSAQLNEIRSKNPNRRYVLIAHSMGGLVARAYLESNLYRNGDVTSLFTLGSPHQGVHDSSFLTVCRFIPKYKEGCNLNTQHALVEMLDMSDFNGTYIQRAPGVNYYLISGNATDSNYNAVGRLFGDGIPGNDDALIQTSSSSTLGGITAAIETDEVHTDKFGSYIYYSPAAQEARSVGYTQCVYPVLHNQPCTGGVQQTTVVSPPVDLNTVTTLAEGQLDAQQVVTTSVDLEGGPALFNASWSDSPAQFTLVSPSGLTIDPAYVQANPTVVEYKSYGPGEIPVVNYYVYNAEPGRWTLRLQGGTTNSGQYALTALVNSTTNITVTPSSGHVEVGSDASINVAVTNASTYTSTFTINKPDGTTYTSTGNIIPTDMGGIYTVETRVTGMTTTNKPFERYEVTYFRASLRSYLPMIIK